MYIHNILYTKAGLEHIHLNQRYATENTIYYLGYGRDYNNETHGFLLSVNNADIAGDYVLWLLADTQYSYFHQIRIISDKLYLMGEYSGAASYFVKHSTDTQTDYMQQTLRAALTNSQCVFLIQIDLCGKGAVQYVNDISALEGNIRCYGMEHSDNRLYISGSIHSYGMFRCDEIYPIKPGCHGILVIFDMQCGYIMLKTYNDTSVITDIALCEDHLYIATRYWTYSCNESGCTDSSCCRNEARICSLNNDGEILMQYVQEDHLIAQFICQCNDVIYSITTSAVEDNFVSTVSKISKISPALHVICTINNYAHDVRIHGNMLYLLVHANNDLSKRSYMMYMIDTVSGRIEHIDLPNNILYYTENPTLSHTVMIPYAGIVQPITPINGRVCVTFNKKHQDA